MRITYAAIPALALLLAGCGALDTITGFSKDFKKTILDLEEKKDAVTDSMVENTVKGAKLYCDNVREEKRLRLRSQTDVAGKGPVIEVHCEAF